MRHEKNGNPPRLLRKNKVLAKDCPDPESKSKGNHKRKFKISE